MRNGNPISMHILLQTVPFVGRVGRGCYEENGPVELKLYRTLHLQIAAVLLLFCRRVSRDPRSRRR